MDSSAESKFGAGRMPKKSAHTAVAAATIKLGAAATATASSVTATETEYSAHGCCCPFMTFQQEGKFHGRPTQEIRMQISCSAGIYDITLALILITFPFYGGIGKGSSSGYDRKVPEYIEFLRKIQPSLYCMCIEFILELSIGNIVPGANINQT